MTAFRRLFRLPDREARVESDVDAEIAFHFEMRTQELVARGAAPEAARATALREFGDITRWRHTMSEIDRERLGRERRAEWWGAAWQDLRYAARGLRRQPGFALVVVLTLALGVGANATMFGIVDRLLLRPPAHARDADRLARIYITRILPGMGEFTASNTSYPDYVVLRDSVPSFAGAAAFFTINQTLGRGAAAEQIHTSAVTGNFFALVGVRPALGRFLLPDDDRPAAAPAAVIGHAFWRRHFGGAPDALGKVLLIGKRSYTVVGVAPAGFTGVELGAIDAWVPTAIWASDAGDAGWATTRNMRWIKVVTRLKPGATHERASVEATEVYRRAQPPDRRAELKATVAVASIIAARTPETLRSQNATVAAWLGGVSVVVLLIACANVANLLLARATRRRREIAVRIALGIGRARLAGQLLVEGLLLATLGTAAGLALARWGGDAARAVLLPEVAWADAAPVDLRTLAFAAAAAVATGLLIGLAPMLQTARPGLVGALKAGAREGAYQKSRLRSTLLVAQAALSVVLLVGAGLFVRSLRNVAGLDMGFDPRRVMVVMLDLPSAGYKREGVEAFYQRAEERVSALPGVERASVAATTPFYSSAATDLRAEGWDSLPSFKGGSPTINAVSWDYFETMGTRIVRGRGFAEGDREGAPRVAVVNETMARTLWPGKEPLGKCLHIGEEGKGPCVQVAGVARDMRRDRLREDEALQYYVPLEQKTWSVGMRALFVRARGGEATPALAAEVRRAVQSLAPSLPYAEVKPLQELIDPHVRPWRLGATMFGAFGVLALVIAAVGLYSVIAYTVAQRTHELGVRVALGARTGHVLRLVVGEGMRVAVAGIALGALGALAGGRFVAPLLFDVSPHDPLVFGGVTLTLLAVAVAASLIPARRAARVDPAVALRTE
ncbi:MAG TPA: ABC transporter permease [Gemmatimonadaceae bacterium]|nr:ABC transporter permease [Gemmatimonadaceae bacterium]